MSLQFILGGSGTGKSELLYEMIIKRSMERPEEKLLLIVPEQYTMQAQRHIVEKHPRHVVMNVDILSFERLAFRVFDELGINQKEILEDTGKSMIIRRLLGSHQEELHAFRGHIRKRGFVERMKTMLSELLQYGITPEVLALKGQELGSHSVLYGKLKDIGLIYKAFLDTIHEKYMTTEEVPERLCGVIDRSELIKNSVIFMDNFRDFTPVQYQLMARILELAPQVIMTIPVDASLNPYSQAEMDNLFYLTRDTIHHLAKICALDHIKRDADILLCDSALGRFKESPELAMLEKQLFREKPRAWEEAPKDIEAWVLAEPRSEMQYVAMRIHELAVSGNYRYEEMAVVASDMERYRQAAAYWFDRYGIPCFFDGRRSVSGNMLVEWMRSLLGMLIQGFSYESVFRYLRCGLSGMAAEETDELEDYVLAMGIRGMSRWKQTWTARGRGMTEENLVRLNEWRQRFIEPLEELYSLSKGKEIQAEPFLEAINRYMEHLDIEQKLSNWQQRFMEKGDLVRVKEYEQIYEVILDLMERVKLILGQERLTVREFLDVLEAGMTDVRVGIIPPGLDQVTFGDIRRTRLDQVRVLFFVGMNDGLVPLVEDGAGLITDGERQILAEHRVKLAPTARENTCTEQFYLYISMTRPSERLILSCSAQDAAGKELRPSTIFERIRQVFPKLELKKLSGEQKELRDVNQGWQYLIQGLRAISEGGTASEDWLPVFDWFYGHPRYREQTRHLVEAAFYRHWDEQLSKAAVAAVYGGELTGGVTMLEKYAACAYAHFLAYGLRLKERQIFQVQAPDIGMIFHQSIERFSRQIGRTGHQWRDIPDDLRDRLAEECVQSVVLNYNHSVMQDSKRAQYLTEKILRMTKRTVWALQQQLKKGDFDPVGYELRFTTELQTDQMRLRYGDKGSLNLNGKIDRMDTCQVDDSLYIKIIDYKSGSTAFDLSSVYYGLQLQLLVYMNAARQEEQKRHPKSLVIPAGVLYYHIDDPLIEAESFKEFSGGEGSPSEDDENKILEELLVDGLVVDEADILRHMDRNPQEAPKVLPVSFKRDGSLTANSSAAPMENFEVLAWHVANRTRQLGQHIFDGDIAVNPYSYGQKKACDFCGYKSVCGFDRTLGGFDYRRLRKIKKDELWEAIKKEAGPWDLNGQKSKERS